MLLLHMDISTYSHYLWCKIQTEMVKTSRRDVKKATGYAVAVAWIEKSKWEKEVLEVLGEDRTGEWQLH